MRTSVPVPLMFVVPLALAAAVLAGVWWVVARYRRRIRALRGLAGIQGNVLGRLRIRAGNELAMRPDDVFVRYVVTTLDRSPAMRPTQTKEIYRAP